MEERRRKAGERAEEVEEEVDLRRENEEEGAAVEAIVRDAHTAGGGERKCEPG